MRFASRSIAALSVLAAGTTVLAGGGTWVDFANETSTRMPASLNDPATSISDDQEKDYAWGDIDRDGCLSVDCQASRRRCADGRFREHLQSQDSLG